MPAQKKRLKSIPALLVVMAALGAAPVSAQDDGSSARYILELQQMREELRELRGMVESQAQEIENLERRQRDQYLDLDGRLGKLSDAQPAMPAVRRPAPGAEGSARPSPEPDRSGSGSAGGGSAMNNDPVPVADDLPEVREPIDQPAEITTLPSTGSTAIRDLEPVSEAEQQAYDQAFRALRETRYADAAEGFDRFLVDHPQSAYAPNALYWLGEVYYVTRDFQTALDQFTRLLEVYPDSSKQADALLKIGYSNYELENWPQARSALEQVIADYPGTNYSRLAENRLRTMRLEGNL